MNTKEFADRHPEDIKLVLNDEGFYFPMEVLYPMVHSWIASMMSPGGESAEAANMSRMIKVSVKGVLVLYGDKMLTMMLGKDHPKPKKGDDIVEWYTDLFARIALGQMSKTVYNVNTESNEYDNYQEISEFSTIPLSE